MKTPVFKLEYGGLPPVVFAGAPELSPQTNPERLIELEDLLSHNLPRFRRIAMRWLRNPEDAEDAVQDAVLSAFKHIARFEGRAQMSTWLMAIVINAVRMQLRRRPRHKILSLDQRLQEEQCTISDVIADPRPTPEQTLEQCELHALVNELAGSLPPRQRAAMQLRDWDDLSTNEAAEALGVPVGTLKAQLARGRAKLTQRLRKALGMPETRTSNSGNRGRRKSSLGARCRRDSGSSAIPIPVFRFEEPGFEEQGAGASWMSA